MTKEYLVESEFISKRKYRVRAANEDEALTRVYESPATCERIDDHSDEACDFAEVTEVRELAC